MTRKRAVGLIWNNFISSKIEELSASWSLIIWQSLLIMWCTHSNHMTAITDDVMLWLMTLCYDFHVYNKLLLIRGGPQPPILDIASYLLRLSLRYRLGWHSVGHIEDCSGRIPFKKVLRFSDHIQQPRTMWPGYVYSTWPYLWFLVWLSLCCKHRLLMLSWMSIKKI